MWQRHSAGALQSSGKFIAYLEILPCGKSVISPFPRMNGSGIVQRKMCIYLNRWGTGAKMTSDFI